MVLLLILVTLVLLALLALLALLVILVLLSNTTLIILKRPKRPIFTPPLITKRYYQLHLYKGIYEAQHVAS